MPLLASYPLEAAGTIIDSGPLKINGQAENATAIPGQRGQALHLDGKGSKILLNGPDIQKIGTNFTFSFWLKLDKLPAKNVLLIQKGGNTGFQLGLSNKGALYYHGSWGGGWYDAGAWGGQVPAGQWVHIAWTFQKGEKGRIYINGTQTGVGNTPFAFYPDGVPLQIGGDDWVGAIDDLKIYAAALTPEQVQTEMGGAAIPTRAATDADLPSFLYPVRMALARFDMPLGFQPYDARQYQTAQRIPGPDATDWPQLNLDGKTPLFTGPTGTSVAEMPLLSEGQASNLFRQSLDHEIQPVKHWLRANSWRWGRKFVYTTDRTARTSTGDYEIWAFPIEIRGPGASDIQSVRLTLAGQTIYERTEKLRSLTLLLPANLNGAPYELAVNGREPVKFDVGLQPVTPGHPDNVPLPVNLTIPGEPNLTVRLKLNPPVFPQQKEWEADLKNLTAAVPAVPTAAPAIGSARYLGIEVPRSPIAVFTASMRAGMSGGHRFNPFHIEGFKGTPEEYAAYLKTNGYDWVFDDATPTTLNDAAFPLERWANAMEAQGLKFGINPDIPGNLGILSNPNLAFQSSFLPEWGQPAYRDAQLLAQRFGHYPNFLGLMIGADNAGYVQYWDWAPTIPDRPWGRAYEQFQQGHPFKAPVATQLGAARSYERVGTESEFLDYIHRYDATFERYGYFTRAMREAAPRATLVSGSYGSSPGVGARGGWPWATIPAKPMLANLPVQMAYDWNELGSSKPLHNVALLDRARSYDPNKPTWALIDDFGLFFGREARQRAYALALTRGVDAIGTTFLAHPTGNENYRSGQMEGLGVSSRPRKPVIAEQQELYAWIKKFGGVYHGTQLQPQIGVLYVHDQAISRRVVGGEKPDEAQLYKGSHEGKTTEALFLCEMAGIPAKIITPEELKRGLPPSMKAILLTGLNRFDKTWLWSEGMEPDLQKFIAGGGKLVADDETVLPTGVPATAAGLHIAAYVTQSNTDQSPLLLQRNQDNVVKLRATLQDLPAPVAASADPTIWAVPHQTGDVQYVTVVNWANEPGKNASQVVRGQSGKLAWHTNRPIYDLTLGQKISPAQAQDVDLTKDAVRVYALPPAPIGVPKVAATTAGDGFYHATVSFSPDIKGVPVELTLKNGVDNVTVYGASGTPIELPITGREAGTWALTARELLSGQSGSTTLNVATVRAVASVAEPGNSPDVAAFLERKSVPLVIAMTPQQAEDPTVSGLAKQLQTALAAKGRTAEIRRIAPNDVVLSLQPLRAQQRYPQWKTVDADLVLLGSPENNLLLLDQARGYLLPPAWRTLANGQSLAAVTYSPFVGERSALNLLARDPDGLAAAVRRITGD